MYTPRVSKQVQAKADESSDELGQRIAHFRKARGITQKDLADNLGIDRTLITNYETGRVRIASETLAHIAIVLGVSADVLLGINQETAPEAISRRFAKRITIIETFPEVQKKRILRNLDDAIEAQLRKTDPDQLEEFTSSRE